jgi:hypothetical protein
MRSSLAVAGFVVVALVVGTCVACTTDGDDDSRGSGVVAMAVPLDYDYDRSGDEGRNGRRCEGAQDCSSFSPTFEDSPVDIRDNNVQVCLPFARCGGSDGDEEPAPV